MSSIARSSSPCAPLSSFAGSPPASPKQSRSSLLRDRSPPRRRQTESDLSAADISVYGFANKVVDLIQHDCENQAKEWIKTCGHVFLDRTRNMDSWIQATRRAFTARRLVGCPEEDEDKDMAGTCSIPSAVSFTAAARILCEAFLSPFVSCDFLEWLWSHGCELKVADFHRLFGPWLMDTMVSKGHTAVVRWLLTRELVTLDPRTRRAAALLETACKHVTDQTLNTVSERSYLSLIEFLAQECKVPVTLGALTNIILSFPRAWQLADKRDGYFELNVQVQALRILLSSSLFIRHVDAASLLFLAATHCKPQCGIFLWRYTQPVYTVTDVRDGFSLIEIAVAACFCPAYSIKEPEAARDALRVWLGFTHSADMIARADIIRLHGLPGASSDNGQAALDMLKQAKEPK